MEYLFPVNPSINECIFSIYVDILYDKRNVDSILYRLDLFDDSGEITNFGKAKRDFLNKLKNES